jgi:hypothetical protein
MSNDTLLREVVAIEFLSKQLKNRWCSWQVCSCKVTGQLRGFLGCQTPFCIEFFHSAEVLLLHYNSYGKTCAHTFLKPSIPESRHNSTVLSINMKGIVKIISKTKWVLDRMFAWMNTGHLLCRLCTYSDHNYCERTQLLGFWF